MRANLARKRYLPPNGLHGDNMYMNATIQSIKVSIKQKIAHNKATVSLH
jgi:hypothetical protein